MEKLDTYYNLKDAKYYDVEDGEYKYYSAYKFTPSETATYEIASDDYSSVAFYDASGNKVQESDGSYKLEANTTYYVAIGRTLYSYDDSYEFKVTKKVVTTSDQNTDPTEQK